MTRIAVLVVLLTGFALRAQDEKPAEVKTALKVLEKRVGSWSTVTTANKAEWTPKPGQTKGDEVLTMTLGGRFLEGKNKSADGIEGQLLATYDVGLGRYRFWYFDSLGTSTEGLGKWDDKTKTLTWTSGAGGITSLAHWKFVDDDTFEWDLVTKDGEGKLLLDMKGKLTRKK